MQISLNLHATLDELQEAGASVISLAANPMDLRPVRNAVIRVMNKKARESGKPQLVVYGENHKVLEHIALPLLHISHAGKSKKQKPVVILEIPQNIQDVIYKAFEEEFKAQGLPLPDNLYDFLEVVDYFTKHCAVTNNLMLATCQKYGFSPVLPDAAVTDCGEYIDLAGDTRVAWLMKQFNIADDRKIPRNSDLGLVMRNECIAESVIAEIRQQRKPHTLILRIGAEHIFGHASDASYPLSLAPIFRRANIDVTYVMPMGPALGDKFIPWQAIDHAEDLVIVKDHAETCFTFRQSRKEEKHLIRVLQQSGYLIPAEPQQS